MGLPLIAAIPYDHGELLTIYMYMPASERLANALYKTGAPDHIINSARLGLYDARKSPFTYPKIALLCDLREANLHKFALCVLAGEYDHAWRECEQCHRVNSAATWETIGNRCPNCGDLFERERVFA